MVEIKKGQSVSGNNTTKNVKNKRVSVSKGLSISTGEYIGFNTLEEYQNSIKNSPVTKTKNQISQLESEIADLEEKLRIAEQFSDKSGFTGEQKLKTDLTLGKSTSNTGLKNIDSLKNSNNKWNVPENKLGDFLSSIGYSSTDEIKKAITEKKSALRQSNTQKEVLELSKISVNPVFDEYASSGETYKGNNVAYLRNNPDKLKEWDEKTDNIGGGRTWADNIAYKGAKYMTEDEYKIFNAYVGAGKNDEAKRFIELLEETLNQRQALAIKEGADSYLSKLGVGWESGVQQFENGLVNLFNNEDDYIPQTGLQMASGLIREDLDGVGRVIYDVTNTTANMLPSILTSTAVGLINPTAGALTGTALMGASASGNAYQEMLNLGYDKSQARTYSILVGASEMALQYALGGISALGGKLTGQFITKMASGLDNALAKFAINYTLSGASEALEEGVQSILEPIFQNIAAGYTVNEDIDWGEVFYSALLGGITGGLFEGTQSATTISNNSSMALKLYGDSELSQRYLVSKGLELPTNTTAHAFAQKYQNQLDGGKMLSGTQLSNLSKSIENEYVSQNTEKINSAVKSRLLQLGESGNVKDIADVVTKKISGEKLSHSEKKIIEYSEYGNQVTTDLYVKNEPWVMEIEIKSLKSENPILQSTANDKATPDGGVASFTPENGERNDTQDVPYGENKEGAESENPSTASGSPPFRQGRQNGERHTLNNSEQKKIKEICKTLGRTVVFEHIPETMKKLGLDTSKGIPDGYIDGKGVIHIGFVSVDPISFVFKHELTHFLEFNKVKYNDFANLIMDSDIFKDWVKSKGYNSVSEYNADIIKWYSQFDSKFDEHKANLEMVANFCGENLFGDKNKIKNLLESLKPVQRNKIVQFVLDFIEAIKKKLKKYDELAAGIEKFEKEYIKLLKEVNEEFSPDNGEDVHEVITEKRTDMSFKTGADNKVGKSGDTSSPSIISLLDKNGVVNKNLTNEQADNNNSIKQQLNQYSNKLNVMDVVFNQNFSVEFDSKQNAVAWVLDKLNKGTPTIKRKDFGEIIFDEKRIRSGIRYSKSKEEIFAFVAVPQILRKGIEISSHSNHKGRNYDTVTFAAPIVINGKRGNMAVVVRIEDRNYYKVHRLLMPDGSQFVFDTKRDTAERAGGVNNNSGLSPTDNVSTDSIPENGNTVNNNSMSENEINTSDLKFSFARVYDEDVIKGAENTEAELKAGNKSEKEIRKEIWGNNHIIRDTTGVWVYEIDDSGMRVDLDGLMLARDDEDFAEFNELYGRERLGKKKRDRSMELFEKFIKKYGLKNTLDNYVKHDKLFEKYPQLKNVKVRFEDLGNANGQYDPATKTITINWDLANKGLKGLKGSDYRLQKLANAIELEPVFLHEIQHALQDIDGRENGSSFKYWNDRFLSGKRLPVNPQTGESFTPWDAYEYTHGEYEAREAERRKNSDDTEREAEMPDLGWGKTISAKETVTAGDIKFSIPSDSSYMSAVENGDTKTAQALTDNAARAAGYTARLYHQTGADFTVFNTDNQRAGKYDWQLPTGTFLKPGDNDIGLSGKKQMGLYAKFENALTFADRAEAQKFWNDNIPEYNAAVKEIQRIDSDYRQRVDEAEADVQDYISEWRRNNPDAQRRDVYNDPEFQRLYDIQQDITEEWEEAENTAAVKAKELINSFISGSGYDGIIIERDDDGKNRYTKSYIAFSSAQMKSADPVTYDDNGEVIPLSERFNVENEDIRYSSPNVNSPEILLERYENGEITRAEYLNALRGEKTLNPVEIADLKEEDADTTPPLKKFKGENIGDKESNTYQSLLDSDIFDDRFKKEIEDDTWIMNYKSITNKETLKKAARELDEGGAAYVKHWDNKDPDHASLIDIAVGFILMDRYQRVGDYESAAAAAERVRMFGTASGRQVQIFSIIGRLDPNAMAVYAQKELSKAFKTMAKERSQKWIDNNADRFNLIEEEIEYIRRRTWQAAALPEGRDKTVKLAEICTLLQNKLPHRKGDSLRALQRISMLLNVKTNIRNIVGNGAMAPVFIASDFFGSGIDKIVSKKTNVRTTGNFDIKSLKGFKKGVFETMDDFRRHINTRNEELNRFEIGSGKAFNENHNKMLAKQLNECAKVLNALDRFTSFCLELGDRPFYEMWYINSINNQIKLNKVSEATPEMIAIASAEALQRTWQDKNKVVQVVSNAKGALNLINIGGYGLGDVYIKFVKTPANLTKAIVDFSPVGIGKAIATDGKRLKNAIETGQFEVSMQKKFVDSLSKGITGTLLYVMAAALASNGLLSGGGDEDKDVSNFEKYIQGIPEYSFKLFGKWHSYEWMQPLGAVAATVTDYMKSAEENPDNEWYENIYGAIKAGGEVLYNQSFMQSIQNLFTAPGGIVEGALESILDEPSVFVPQLVSQTASATDDYRRVTYENNKPFETALNKVKVKIPGLRQTLEKQTDIFGRDVPNSQGDFINAFINPANTFTNTSNEVTNELYALYKQTKNKTVMPRVAPYSVTVKGNQQSFTAEERMDFQRISGNVSNEMLNIAFKNNGYNKLSAEEKVKLVNKIYDFSAAYAKSSLEYDYTTVSAMVGEYKNGKPILTEEKYNDLTDSAKEYIVQEYFLSRTEVKYMDNYDRLINYYIKQAKE